MYKVEHSIEYNDYFGYIYAETIDIDGWKVKVEHFCDKNYNGEKRYSYEIKYPHNGIHTMGGYGEDNEIVFPTFDSAFDSALRVVCYPINENLGKYREIKLNMLLNENLGS